MNKTPFFDRNGTQILKGIALIMMFYHHFFTFPNWWPEGAEYPLLEQLAPYFCVPLKMCVPVFCFLTGYFYYFAKNKTLLYSVKKITDILIFYWGVFFVFAISAVACGYHYDLIPFLLEIPALFRPTMWFCWYVYFYYISMLALPFLTRLMSPKYWLDLIISVVIVPVVLFCGLRAADSALAQEVLQNLLFWLPTLLSGYVVAQHDIFRKIERFETDLIHSDRVRMIVYVFSVLLLPMCRHFSPNTFIHLFNAKVLNHSVIAYVNLDVILTPLFIYSVIQIHNRVSLPFVEKILSQIGKYSLLMWFASCIFYNNSKAVFNPILYYPHNPVLVTVWGLLLCYVFSFVMDKVLSKVVNIKNSLMP